MIYIYIISTPFHSPFLLPLSYGEVCLLLLSLPPAHSFSFCTKTPLGVGGHNNMFPHWKTYQLALGASFERENAMQGLSLRLRGEGKPFLPFRFRMYLKDFLAFFK